jgi:hypothetical protein
MPEATVAADLDEPLDVEINLLPKITFYLVSLIDNLADAVYLIICEISNPCIGVNVRLLQDFFTQHRSDAI